MTRRFWILTSLAIVAAVAAVATVVLLRPDGEASNQARGSASNGCPDFEESSLTVGEETISVSVAQSDEERHIGLSGCADIPDDSGMYFVFAEPKQAVFWMKDMAVPLDIIWITDEKVVGIDKDVPAPTEGQADRDLPHYTAPMPVDAVLELAAGATGRLDIEVGTIITQEE